MELMIKRNADIFLRENCKSQRKYGKKMDTEMSFCDLTEKQICHRFESKHIISLGIISECIKTVL